MARRTKIIFLSLLVSAAALYAFLSPKENASFPDVVLSSFRPDPQWSIPGPTPAEEKKLRAILSQKFTICGEGKHAIAFQSEDEKYVIKFFKMRGLMPTLRDYLCPYFARKQKRKFEAVFSGYKNGFQDLRRESGLIWIHLAKTTSLNQMITLFDQNGKEHYIDADSTEFVVQEKAELIFDRLSRLYRGGKASEAEQAIASFYDFIRYQTDRGYLNRDHNVAYNYGFVGDRPIQIDLGRLDKRRNRKMRPEGGYLKRIQQNVEHWKAEQQPSQQKINQ